MVGNAAMLEARDATIAAAIAGDEMAFARIVRDHHDDMARVCQVITGDPDLAQEAAQAAWPIAWRRLRTLRDAAKLRAWLVTIAANEARHLLRRQRRDRVVAIDAVEVVSREQDPGGRVDALDLMHAFRRLDVADRELLSLRYVAGFDATEIGLAIRMTPSGVRTRLSRLIARLRLEVGDA